MLEIKTIDTNKKVEAWDLLELRDALGINESDFILLMEAYRRKHLQPDRDKNILGRGTPKEYKSKFFTPLDKTHVQSGMQSCYTLSKRGLEIMELIEKFVPKPKYQDKIEKLNTLLRGFKM